MGLSASFSILASAAIRQDNRNQIGPGILNSGTSAPMPAEISQSYWDVSPARLFLRIENGLGLDIFPLKALNEMQLEYRCNPHYVFASLEGDPITLFDGAVWTAPHGVSNYSYEKIADSLEDYWKELHTQLDSN